MGQLATVFDDDLLARGAELGAEQVAGLDDVFSVDDVAEDDVSPVESAGGFDHAEVELTGVCVLLPTIRHGHHKRSIIMTVLKILIRKVPTIYTIPTCAVSIRDITTLTQIKRDDPVELTTLVVQLFP